VCLQCETWTGSLIGLETRLIMTGNPDQWSGHALTTTSGQQERSRQLSIQKSSHLGFAHCANLGGGKLA